MYSLTIDEVSSPHWYTKATLRLYTYDQSIELAQTGESSADKRYLSTRDTISNNSTLSSSAFKSLSPMYKIRLFTLVDATEPLVHNSSHYSLPNVAIAPEDFADRILYFKTKTLSATIVPPRPGFRYTPA